MPRSQFAFQIARGGTTIGKVQRYLRAAGLDAPIFVTEKARQRHIHPRHLRHVEPPPELKGVDLFAPIEPVNPFAAFGKKP